MRATDSKQTEPVLQYLSIDKRSEPHSEELQKAIRSLWKLNRLDGDGDAEVLTHNVASGQLDSDQELWANARPVRAHASIFAVSS
jgi:hypothetical protein